MNPTIPSNEDPNLQRVTSDILRQPSDLGYQPSSELIRFDSYKPMLKTYEDPNLQRVTSDILRQPSYQPSNELLRFDSYKPVLKKMSSFDSNYGYPYPEINMSRYSSVAPKDYFNLNNGDAIQDEKEQSPQPPQLQTRQSSKVKAREQFSNKINKKKIQKKPQIQNKQIKPQPEEPKRQEVFKKKVKKLVQLLPCNCTNSNCVKRYCRCFHSGQKCVEDCQCQNCKNNDQYAEDRNKAIYHVKTKCHRDKRIPQENLFKLTFIACSCKKSNCQKNYCECFLRGNKCGITCECENCENGQEEAYRQQQELKSKGGKKR